MENLVPEALLNHALWAENKAFFPGVDMAKSVSDYKKTVEAIADATLFGLPRLATALAHLQTDAVTDQTKIDAVSDQMKKLGVKTEAGLDAWQRLVEECKKGVEASHARLCDKVKGLVETSVKEGGHSSIDKRAVKAATEGLPAADESVVFATRYFDVAYSNRVRYGLRPLAPPGRDPAGPPPYMLCL